jgi:hypothetical protein
MTVYTCIRGVLGSDLGRNTGYPGMFLMPFLSSYMRIPGQYLDYPTAASFQILSNSSVIVPFGAILISILTTA